MKHQIKALLTDTRAVLQRLDDQAVEAEKEWHKVSEPKFRALRDMLTERLRRGKPVTPEDVIDPCKPSVFAKTYERVSDDE